MRTVVGRARTASRENDYPERWNVWEDELLAPPLNCDPDDTAFISYTEL
ncbi:MAG TPA: hypothetical protein VFJ06_13045 [Halococcus sp.]|nr:hypothetical protein [Halococcus sp.]